MKKVIPLAFAVAGGFLLHMFFFSDVLPEAIIPSRPSRADASNTRTGGPTPEFSKSTTYIEYKDGAFRPKTATSKVGNHILVRNMDTKEHMLLDSSAGFLKTTRPYALSEQIDIVPKISGTFVVENKLNPEARFTIIIKP